LHQSGRVDGQASKTRSSPVCSRKKREILYLLENLFSYPSIFYYSIGENPTGEHSDGDKFRKGFAKKKKEKKKHNANERK